MTKKYYSLTLAAFLTIVTLVLLIVFAAGAAHAASLRICITADTTPDPLTAPVYLNGTLLIPDLLDGATLGSTRCNTASIPDTIPRNVDQVVTVTYKNIIGEESAPSNALPFRLPSRPPVPNLSTIQIVTP